MGINCEMQTASCRIWTRLAKSVSHSDNRHVTSAFVNILLKEP